MKILLDTCVWGGAVAELRSAGHDAVWVGEWAHDPGDDEILAHAHEQQRVLVTLDKDFGEIAILRRVAHSGIVRLVSFSARQQASACMDVLSRYGDELIVGAIVTAEPGRVRIRPPEPPEVSGEADQPGNEECK